MSLSQEDLKRLSEIEKIVWGTGAVVGPSDTNLVRASVLLVKAIDALDKTSTRLSTVLIWLALAMLLVAVLQLAVTVIQFVPVHH